jgi:23S rRNA pseudouridine1911/1915/1917 synthase
MTQNGPIRAEVPAELAGERLDKFLAGAVPGLSRARIQALIADGLVSERGAPATKGSVKVAPGQIFDIILPQPEPARPKAEAIDLHILYEDSALLVLDKPAGMVVHPAAGNPAGTLVNALLAHCGESLSGIGGVKRPGIVHRLDKDTSGLMVVAKSDAAHQGLSAQFADRSLSRSYKAVVFGAPSPGEGSISAPIARSKSDRKKMAVAAAGKPAVTHYRVERALGPAASLVDCELETGRTHQIRVHMSHIGHPVVGDAAYGGRAARRGLERMSDTAKALAQSMGRQALHAYALRFVHPESGEEMEFESGLPADIRLLIETLQGECAR